MRIPRGTSMEMMSKYTSEAAELAIQGNSHGNKTTSIFQAKYLGKREHYQMADCPQ